MAATIDTKCAFNTSPNPKPVRVCFSFAAYAKNLIDTLHDSNLQITQGLADSEFSTIESTFRFTFPPDLRSILREGLPVDAGFPNWRSSSTQQLRILIDLPILNLCRQVSRRKFWFDTWGIRPQDDDEAVNLARGFLKEAPVLVPIYRNCYIPAIPCLAGNPVFYVNGDDIKLWSFDITGFFQQVEFRNNGELLKRPTSLYNLINAPAWAATEARRVEFWTELAAKEKKEAREDKRGWWSGELCGCLDEVYGRLKEGGWKEDDVREMMMMDGCDEKLSWSPASSPTLDQEDYSSSSSSSNTSVKDEVELHVRVLSETLLRAGWSSEDVVDLLGFQDDDHDKGVYCFDDEDSNWLDFV